MEMNSREEVMLWRKYEEADIEKVGKCLLGRRRVLKRGFLIWTGIFWTVNIN